MIEDSPLATHFREDVGFALVGFFERRLAFKKHLQYTSITIMKMLISVAFIFGIVEMTYGLSCYSCNDGDFSGGVSDDCFTASAGSGAACTTTGTEYCLSTFTIEDGVATSVRRECADAAATSTDPGAHNPNSNTIPTTDFCVTTLQPSVNPADTTVCYFHCSTDDCNTKQAGGLLACSSTCSVNSNGCDYITGKCACVANFEGDDCNTATATTATSTRQCVQCNSETDSTCATTTSGSNCPGTQQYCSTATSTIYGADGTSKKTVTTRGCVTSMLVVDECSFTDIYTDPPINDASLGYKEITCASTCSSDNCNTNTANGVIDGNEAVTMYCVQCTGTSDDLTGSGTCAEMTTRKLCPVGTTHCKATAEYLISEKVDLSSPSAAPNYSFQSITRECATAAVTTECTNATFAGVNGVQKVTCTETCDTDGCNDGWPARPKCISCVSSNYADGYDDCLENPPDAGMCSEPYHAYCTTHETGIPKSNRRDSVSGFRRRMVRACSPFDIGSSCSTETFRNIEIDTCNYTCTDDGCNQGTSGGFVPVQNMIAVMIPAFLGWLIQMHL